MTIHTTHPTTKLIWSRSYLIKILDAALATGENRFANQAALVWLSSYPGDLPVNFLHAKALIADGFHQQAVDLLQNLVLVDPEFLEAQSLLFKTSSQLCIKGSEMAHGCSVALKNRALHSQPLMEKTPNWSQLLAKTRGEMKKGNLDKAEILIQEVLATASHSPLCAVTHLRILRGKGNTHRRSLHAIAEHYHQHWPECLQFMLILVETLMDMGQSVEAVGMLHKIASQDVTGQVAHRIWGTNHPYQSLWPQKLEALIRVQIPARVAGHLGWNLLPQPADYPSITKLPDPFLDGNILADVTGKDNAGLELVVEPSVSIHPTTQKTSLAEESKPEYKPDPVDEKTQKSETFKKFESELYERQSMRKQRKHPNSEGRFPVYVIFTTQKGLHKKYGIDTTVIIDREVRKLVASIRKRLDWGASFIYADEPGCMAQFDLKPVPADDPWRLKLAITDLDKSLGKRGAKVGAVLILGGPEVVPFHYLPNPTDDTDVNVPSDNPYGTSDVNYFIPEWPVGRLPGGTGKDPGLLISALRAMTERHGSLNSKSENLVSTFWNWILNILQIDRNNKQSSFGFSAEAWKLASGLVFRPIGDPSTLVTSPPIEIYQKRPLPVTKLGYFNLHGVADSPEWFGQRDPKNEDFGADYPVALHPKDVQNGGRSPKIIFSEACYGAHILEKSVEEALALKFLSSGSQAVVGSTAISYGSITTPLNAADLLGRAFWNKLKEGYTVGESLRHSKIFLAGEMHRRQGYLDGEDQKTLISFILYGDPLARQNELSDWKTRKIPNEISRLQEEIKTICDRVEVPGTSEPIPKEIVSKVKKIVEQYLPGMRDAQLSMSHEHLECCCEGHTCPTSDLGRKTKFDQTPTRRVVTLSKQVVRARHVHESYARLTLDKDGEIVKLAVSR